jgi:hypothetical protein
LKYFLRNKEEIEMLTPYSYIGAAHAHIQEMQEKGRIEKLREAPAVHTDIAYDLIDDCHVSQIGPEFTHACNNHIRKLLRLAAEIEERNQAHLFPK